MDFDSCTQGASDVKYSQRSRRFNKRRKREERPGIDTTSKNDTSVENGKLFETYNNMVVAPSSQAAIKHRVGQSVNLPGAPLRTEVNPKMDRSESERKKKEMRLLRFQPASTLSESLVSVAIVSDSKKKRDKVRRRRG